MWIQFVETWFYCDTMIVINANEWYLACTGPNARYQSFGRKMMECVEWRHFVCCYGSGVGYTMRDIRYFWRDGLNSVGMSGEVELPQFRVLGHRQRATEINLTTGTDIHRNKKKQY